MEDTFATLPRPENNRATALYHVIFRAAFEKTIKPLLFQFGF